MAYDFPNAPTVGQAYQGFVWDGEKWQGQGSGIQGAVRFDIAQGLTAPQQSQARSNIRAAPFEANTINNLLVNGFMDVAQGPNSVQIAGGVGTYVVDQWMCANTNAAAMTASQHLFDPVLGRSVAVTSNNAAFTAGAGDAVYTLQPVEGLRWAKLGFGSTAIASIAIGFWVYSTAGGTMTLNVRNGVANRSYCVPIVIPAGAWTYRTAVIPPCTDGAWPADNTMAAAVGFTWGCGSTYTAPTANTWLTGNYLAAPGQTNMLNAVNATCYVGGVTVLPGTVPMPQEQFLLMRRDPAEELYLCQRYFEAAESGNGYNVLATGVSANANEAVLSFPLKVKKRVLPTFSWTGGFVLLKTGWTVQVPIATLIALYAGADAVTLKITTSGGQVLNDNVCLAQLNNAAGKIFFNARM